MIDQYGRWYPDYPGQQIMNDPAYQRMIGQQVQATPQPAPAPTKHAEIIQVVDMESIDRFSIPAGVSQIFMTRDDEHIIIRSMYANGQHTDDIYDRRPPAPAVQPIDADQFVRKDEIVKLIAEAMQTKGGKGAKNKEDE